MLLFHVWGSLEVVDRGFISLYTYIYTCNAHDHLIVAPRRLVHFLLDLVVEFHLSASMASGLGSSYSVYSPLSDTRDDRFVLIQGGNLN